MSATIAPPVVQPCVVWLQAYSFSHLPMHEPLMVTFFTWASRSGMMIGMPDVSKIGTLMRSILSLEMTPLVSVYFALTGRRLTGSDGPLKPGQIDSSDAVFTDSSRKPNVLPSVEARAPPVFTVLVAVSTC